MASKRTTLIVYGVILASAVVIPTFMVMFPEMAGRVFTPIPMLVAALGIVFVVASLFKRDPSLLIVGVGFLLETGGDHYSNHWMIELGILVSGLGLIWLIKRQAATAHLS